MVEIIELEPDSIEIPEGVAAGRLGFKGERKVPRDFHDLYRRSLQRTIEIAEPIAIIEDFPIRLESGSININEKSIPGDLVIKHLGGSSATTVLLVTIGKGMDDLISEEQKRGDTLTSFFMDGIASEYVEFAVRKVDSFLRERYPHRSGGVRISPGYGDLPLELNQWIIDVLGGNDFGISCMEDSFQLVPRKTVSAFIGWRDEK